MFSAEEHEHDEIFQDVVAERALELGDEETPEAAQGGGGVWSSAVAALCRGKLGIGVSRSFPVSRRQS